jgi:MFS family permease
MLRHIPRNVAGWTVYALAYLGFALATDARHVWILIAVYGLFYGLTEGGERALLADVADPGARGQAYGWYHGVIGVGALPASVVFGMLWQWLGPRAAFTYGMGMALVSTLAAA